MNDQKPFERFLSERFDEVEPGRRMSDALRDDLRSRASATRQHPRWLALIEEPPMRTDSHLTVGSPAVRVAAIIVATMLLIAALAGAGIAGARLLANDGAIVVAQDGSGDYTTINEAVAVAEDGDTVLIRPGTYVEAVVVETEITISGDGPVEEIILEAPEDGPEVPTADSDSRPAAYALSLRDSAAIVSGFTLKGKVSRIHAKGGSPVLESLVLEGVDTPHDWGSTDLGGVIVSAGSRATIRDSLFEGGAGVGVYDGSEPLITGNTLRGGASIGAYFGDGTVVRDNEISGAHFSSIGFYAPTGVLIEDNTISGSPTGIWIDPASSDGASPLIRSNTIAGCDNGIVVGSGTAPTIEGNTLSANDVAGIELSWGAGTGLIAGNDFVDNAVGITVRQTDTHIDGNTIQGGTAGVVIHDGTPSLTSNTIEGAAEVGLSVGRGTEPILTGNDICHNGTNLVVGTGAEPVMQGNEICPD